MEITIKETIGFTRRVTELLTDDEYTALQWFLNFQPKAGVVIPGTGGSRKLRWNQEGKGKRSGLRVIYYFHSKRNQLWMLSVFSKIVSEDLSASDKKI